MDQIIYKYPFQITDNFSLELPYGAQILGAFIQHEQPCLWALVQPKIGKTQIRKFRIFGTGHPVPIRLHLKHISTFPEQDGRLIWHLFEV